MNKVNALDVINLLAFRLAEAVIDKKAATEPYSHILLQPSGALWATDGYGFVHHPAAVRPFEGGSVMVKLDKDLTAPMARRALLFKPEDPLTLSIYPDSSMAILGNGEWDSIVRVIKDADGAYPHMEQFLPRGGVNLTTGFIGLSADLLLRLTRVVNTHYPPAKKGSATWPGSGLWEFVMVRSTVGMRLRIAQDPDLMAVVLPHNTHEEWTANSPYEADFARSWPLHRPVGTKPAEDAG